MIVSPLISLQRDQVESLAGTLRARQRNSTLSAKEQSEARGLPARGLLDELP